MTKAELNNPIFPSIIAEPVWDNVVQWFFREDYDVPHMKDIIDLSSYSQVSSLSAKIYYYVYYKMMPAPWGPKPTPWNENKAFSFRNWLTHGCPKDQAALDEFKKNQAAIAKDTSLRHRKNINDITEVEKENLIKAFQGIMDLDDSDKNSFYHLGGIHWYPAPTYCEHHIHPFLAWHRAYILQFENALRSIPGCKDVTLPYWDISDDRYPEIFSEGPFATYKVPQEFLDQHPEQAGDANQYPLNADGVIKRYEKDVYNAMKWAYIRDATHDPTNTNKVYLDRIIQFPSWNSFNGLNTKGVYVASESLMHAHDMIHNSNGLTTANQDVTGFEPVFWLFHANWDRLMWQWQKLHHTTNVDDFKKNVQAAGDSADWVDGVGLNMMDPFTKTLGLTVDQTIDLNAMGINYVEPPLPLTIAENFTVTEMSLHRSADKGQSKKSQFKINNFSHLSLRVKDVNRLKIPGAFTVSLYLGEELVQKRFFFQATKPGDCPNCVKQAFVSFDFEFENERLQKADGKVKVEIQLSLENEDGKRPVIPFKEIGNPTINIRLIH
jgi:tyrosinase